MIVIIDYKVGNLFSLKSSFRAIGHNIVVTDDTETIQRADKIILPGVGAFEDASLKLRNTGLGRLLLDEARKKKPIMGVCLGMQLLFEKSYEYGEHPGLGLIKGVVEPISSIAPSSLKIPHTGWNDLKLKKPGKLFKYIKDGDFVYFVHSYYATRCEKNITAVTEYGCEITASVESDNIFGCQFHPEKSGEVGLNILRAFTEL